MDREEELRCLRADLAKLARQLELFTERVDRLERRAPEPGEREVRPAMPPPLPQAPILEAPLAPPPVRQPLAPIPPREPAILSAASTPPAAPPRPAPVAQQEGVIERFLRERFEEFRAKSREMGWEMSLGTYWLPRVAVLLIAIAVVFFTSLAIERWGARWMPHIRVLVGYGVCIALLAMAWRSEKKYAGLARVLYGGGFAVMYFVTFATHFIRFARIFESSTTTLLLLTAVVAAWAAAAQWRQSKVIAVLVTSLGHLTVLIATLTLARPGGPSMMGLVVLAAGSAFFLLKNRWYYVASIGIAGSYLNDFVVLMKGQGVNPYTDFMGAMGVLTAFVLIFALAELFSPEDLRRNRVPTWFRSLFASVNMLAFFALGTLLIAHYEFTRPHQDLFRFLCAAVLLLIALGYLRLRTADPLYNLYMTTAVAVFTIGLATRYGGSTLAASLAVETIVLLWSARRSGLLVSRILALAVACVALAYGIATGALHAVAYDAPDYWMRLFQGCLSFAVFFAASQLYQRTNWVLRSPDTLPLPAEGQLLFWQLDFINAKPAYPVGLQKPLEGLLFPYLYALGGAAILLANIHMLTADGHRFAAAALASSIVLAVGVLVESRPFAVASLALLLVGAVPVGTLELSETNGAPRWAALAGLAAMSIIALSSEAERVGPRQALAFHQHRVAPYALYGVAAWLLGLLFVREFAACNVSLAFTAAAAVAAGLALLLHPMALTGITTAYLVWACGLYAWAVSPAPGLQSWNFHAAAWAIAFGALFADRFVAERRVLAPMAFVACAILVANAWVALMLYLRAAVPTSWLAPAVAVSSYAFLAYGGGFRSPMALFTAVLGAALASLGLVGRTMDLRGFEGETVLAFVLLAGFWLLCERLIWLYHGQLREKLTAWNFHVVESREKDYTLGIPVAIATVMILVLLYRVPYQLDSNPTFITMGWFGVAIVLYLLSLPFHQALYRYLGLAVIALSLARVFFIDMKEQDPLLRVAAFAVLGIGLLALSYGYFQWMAKTRKIEVAESDPGPSD